MKSLLSILCALCFSMYVSASVLFVDHFTIYTTDNNFNTSYPQWSFEEANNASVDIDIVRLSGGNQFSALRVKINPMHTSMDSSSLLLKREFEATPGQLYTLSMHGYAFRQNGLDDFLVNVKAVAGDQEFSITSLSLPNDRDNFQTTSVEFDLSGLASVDPNAELCFELGGNYQWIDIDYISLSINQFDADGDGLGDDDEVNIYATDPNDIDSDDDGLSDQDEVLIHGTNPTTNDSDSDGINDPTEITNGTDPNNENDPNQQPSRFELLLYDENKDFFSRDILYYALQDGQTLDLNEHGNRQFNLRYYSISLNPDRIQFSINGEIVRVMNQSPYLLEGENGQWLPNHGQHVIEAVEMDALGQVVAQTNITLYVEDALSHRRRTVRITTQGSNDLIQLQMRKHAFPFGCVVQPKLLNDSWYQNTFFSNFNASVHENALKWYSNQGYNAGSPNYQTAENMYNLLANQGIPMRGHTFFWGMADNGNNGYNSQMWDPNWVEDQILADPDIGLGYVEQRARSVASFWKGRIDEWDFNNEMGHGDWYRDLITTRGPQGYTITKQMVDWALEENPDLKIYHNDYGILPDRHFAFSFACLLKKLKHEGVPIDGIGIQGHFENHPPDQAVVQAALDTLDDFGVPIKITEFDCAIGSSNNNDLDDELAEADGLEIVYRTAFEHPAVEGILAWGFWQNGHWRPAAAFYKNNKDITLQGLRYRQLVFDEWWSNVELCANENGQVSGTIFAGDYDLLINGATYPVSIPSGYKRADIIVSNNTVNVVMPIEIKLAKPVLGNRYGPMELIDMEVQIIGNTDLVDRIEFYVGDQIIKSDSVFPFTAKWKNSSVGSHEVWSRCYYTSGEIEDSSTNHIEVLDYQSIGQTVLQDTGFEASTDGWESIGNDIGQGGVTEITSLRSKSGSYSLLTRNRNADWHGPMSVRNLHGLMQDGLVYQFSCYAQVGSGSERVQIQMKEKKSNKPETYTTIGHGRCSDSEWTFLDGYIRANDLSDVEEMFIYINSPDQSVDIYIDNVSLRAIPENILDIDSDGINDVWEHFYLGNLTQATIGSDKDGDEKSDLFEFRSYTDPTDMSSSFDISPIRFEGDNTILEWNSVFNSKYRVLKTYDLNNQWEVLQEAINGDGGLITQTINTTNLQVFFRVDLDE